VRFEVETIKPRIGAVIHVDRDDILNPEVAERCKELIEDRTVLVFPKLNLSDKEQLALTDNFGGRVYYSTGVPGGKAAEADVYKLTLDPDVNDQPNFVYSNFFWHFDGGMGHQPLPAATMLSARSVATKGGQTEYCSTYAGYESLSDEDKDEIDGLMGVYDFPYGMARTVLGTPSEEDNKSWELAVRRMRGQDPVKDAADPLEKRHPLAWKHKNGRTSLLLAQTTIREVEGLPVAHGRALVQRLLEHTTQPDFRYRHDWQEGDLLIWNNTAALHRVMPYDAASGRVMHRTTVGGTEIPN
jgi:alpha-ketoglutarate-dependent taurine dioxygenase